MAMPWAAAQDLMPRELPGTGAAVLRFEAAPDVHGWAADDSPIVLERLESLVVTGDQPGREPVTIGSVRLERMSVGGLESLAAELSEWIGRPLTEVGLDRLTEVVLRHYDDRDRPMNEIWIPPQSGEGGVLHVELVEGRVGAVAVETLRHFNSDLLGSGMRLRQGDLLRTSDMQSELDWLSRNPFRQAELFVAPGEGVSADLMIRMNERRPWRVYAGYDNSGSESVGENRYFAGFNWGNGFGLDQVIGYQFTMGDSLDVFQAHSVSWEIPVHPWRGFFRLSGAWAEVSSIDTQAGLQVNADGTSWQVGLLYGAPLPRVGDWRHEVRGGVEFKRADNFVIFGQTSLPQNEVDVVQFRGEWQGNGSLWGGRAEAKAELVASPGGITDRNNRTQFQAFRTGADPEYIYGRIEGSWVRPLPAGWSCRVHGIGQLASGALLPTEQLGLGGHQTVRGYAERVYLADSGYAISAELRTPAWSPSAGSLGRLPLQGLVFLDHGRGWRESEGAQTLTSIGIGARAALGAYGSARLDVGWGLEDGQGAEIHGGVTLWY
ncbi:hemolysin activation/secretion peptide [Haloferula helveola]|uniref:Hemolysin activation/secretion peptide n=1 Tax=Haloferula helveola TaxID=490095 RepID=A0ABM7RG01_9BACT|nr:hemolysin activation/secretion peptide [Haloferula helveola]